MAGEWVKLVKHTPEKPEVLRMARLLRIDRDTLLGKLCRFWFWADSNVVADPVTRNGRVDGVVSTDVDAVVTQPGFTKAMQEVGWLSFDDDAQVIHIPNFGRHNGESAKKRALASERQARWRNGDVDGDASTRGEEIREEPTAVTTQHKDRTTNSTKTVSRATRLWDWLVQAGLAEKDGDAAGVALPPDFMAYIATTRPDLDEAATWVRFRDHWISTPGKGGLKLDWPATWRKWVAGERAERGGGAVTKAAGAVERRNDQNLAGWTPPGAQAPADGPELKVVLPADDEPY